MCDWRKLKAKFHEYLAGIQALRIVDKFFLLSSLKINERSEERKANIFKRSLDKYTLKRGSKERFIDKKASSVHHFFNLPETETILLSKSPSFPSLPISIPLPPFPSLFQTLSVADQSPVVIPCYKVIRRWITNWGGGETRFRGE